MNPRPICDNCVFFFPMHEIGAGDERCDGTCGLTGDIVSIFGYCEEHKMDEWFNEDSC